MAARFRSNEDHTRLISKSIFVTNFPDSTSSNDLWKLCQGYGTVVDIYIPNRKSKAGKRFAFVRFIKVDNIDRLVGNLCTLWIGRIHLHANVVRFERSSTHSSRPTFSTRPKNFGASSFATVLKGNVNTPLSTTAAPAMVIDDSCVVTRDLELYVMGEVKKLSFIPNLCVLLSNEGFQNVKLMYLGGLWVMIELESLKTKKKFMQHVGVASWFNRLCNAQSDFVSKEREVMELEESKDNLFARKRICTMTKQEDNILEKFKIIVQGKIFVIRAKELFVWSLGFKEDKEVVYCTDDESVKGSGEDKGEASKNVNSDAESDGKGVSDTYFGENEDNLGNEQHSEQPMNEKETSQDPFNIYDLLRKRDGGVINSGSDKSILYPPGFTPEKENYKVGVQEVKDKNFESSHCRSEGLCSRVLEDGQHTDDHFSYGDCTNGHKLKKRGSILEVLNDMIKVGQTMSEAIGNSGGILCTWDPNVFIKEQHILSDNFVAIFGTWIPTKTKLLIISIYAPQPRTEKCSLWNYIMSLVTRWHGDSIVIWDFNEVRNANERMGSVFNVQGATEFNDFISNSGLVDIQLEGYSFTWSHPSASKMSKLDRFLVSEGLISLFPHISAICLDRHLSDHRPILLRDVIADYGATPFRLYHSWLSLSGFKHMVTHAWNSIALDDRNGMVRFQKKLQALKKEIRMWVADHKWKQTGRRNEIKLKLIDVDKQLDQGGVSDDILLSRMDLMKKLQDIKSSDAHDFLQKAKIQWSIEGDENSKFFHGIINRKRANLFQAPSVNRSKINFLFPNRLTPDYVIELEKPITRDEIRNAAWACEENKSPGLMGLRSNSFPISLIGSLYKVVTKILAIKLSSVIANLISDVQTAFLPNRQILDGPFIINELLSWCKHKKQQAMIFKVDFAKAYDSIRWNFLDDVLQSFGFGSKWRYWILGSLSSGMASILVNGSPTSEFQFHCGLKQGDPLAPYLFILVMESLHLSFSRVVDASIFKGIKIGNSITISHLFYVDDAVFVDEWSDDNLSRIMHVLHYFSLSSGLKINVKKVIF
nr:RNA-directed DNA polymerase, eukaryota [Tanacetum cinerariifolium]